MKRLFFALAVMLGLASCKIDRDPSFVVQEMMNIQNGLLVNDEGVKFSIAGQAMASDILAQDRVFITGTATRSEIAGYDYLLEPVEWFDVTVQDCIVLSTVESPDDSLGVSPVSLSHVWFQGGYVNALVTVSFDTNEDFHGKVNLVYDDTRSNGSNYLCFLLKNKQTGKTWEDEDLSEQEVVFGSQFFSFPYPQGYDSSFKGEQTIFIEWRWYDASPYGDELPLRTVSSKEGSFVINVL